ncbi:membrane protein [Arthrobacter phage Bauer]|uniref:Membrane protein n=1 Tax=Arthrobacter phage Bauer TaxID=2985648 RepID=A0A9E8AAU2_9CAUD|nr:membrane protein [Arthrobacter phage Bauer]UYM26615.1 membrane protein [Arthrobacter phage Bauer]
MKDTIKIIAAILGVLVGIVLISWAGWAISVATSGPKGQGDAIKINNSAANWTEKQAKFEKLYAAVQTNEELVAMHSERVAADPSDKTAAQMLAGVKSECVASVNAYNAESRKVLSQDWKSPDLPHKLTTANCK